MNATEAYQAASAAAAATAPALVKERARDLGVPFDGTPGPNNAITDVAGVLVGHTTLISGEGKLVVGRGPARTGVTAIWPRGKGKSEPVFAEHFNHCAAGFGDELGIDLRAAIFDGTTRDLDRTDRTQPALFTVDVTEDELVTRFGRVVRVVAEPGLHVTAPFDRVVRLDKRVLFSRPPRSEYLTVDKKNIVIESLATWRIADPSRGALDCALLRAGNAQPKNCHGYCA